MDRRYIMLESKLCKELELIEEKYRNGADMSEGDLRRVDLLAHSLKCLIGYTTMKQSENHENNSSYNSSYNSYNGNSYQNNSYANGYPQGHDMSRDMQRMPYYPEERRW